MDFLIRDTPKSCIFSRTTKEIRWHTSDGSNMEQRQLLRGWPAHVNCFFLPSALICIYSKIKVTNRRNDDSNSQHGVVELDLIDKEEYFYRFHYDEGTRNSQTSQYTKLTTCRFDATHHTVNAVRGSQRCLALRRQES
jgi:hypothetical protein